LRGGGDPFLSGDDLQALAKALAAEGITKVDGDFVYDASALIEVPQINLPSIDAPVVKRQPPTSPNMQPGMPVPNQPARQPQTPLALTNPKYGGANSAPSIYEQQGAVQATMTPPTKPAYPTLDSHPSLTAPQRFATSGPTVAAPTTPPASAAPSNYPAPQNYPAVPQSVPKVESGLALETKPIQQLSPAALSRLGNLDETSVVLAVVGDQSVLAGDLLWQINQQLAPHIGVAPEEELAKARIQGMQMLLPKVIENKLVFMDFLRTIPREKFPEIEGRIYKEFNRTKLPMLLKEAKLDTPAELDAELRKIGSSLAKQQRLFLEQLVGQQMVQQNVRMNREITHDEMLKYYYDHSSDYEHPANVKWERIMVRWTEFPTKRAALETLITAGDRVHLKGHPFSVVAKEVSQGPNASLGGLFESTTKGSLRSEKIERAIFALPVGKMASIIQDEEGAHIIRVIERTEAGRTAFEEVQSDIKLAIRKGRFEEQVKDYLAKLKKETMVQTIFDQPASQIASPRTDTLLR
ncbi:MAG: peptidyl-prolyl cis-trans isomerase, partial [Planctomycetota bacterium]